MKWEKLGLVYAPDGTLEWGQQYALLPTPLLINDAVIRVFYASLDDNQRGHIGVIDVSASDPTCIISQRNMPLLSPGLPGLFDDSGVNPSCFLHTDEGDFMLYIGWQRLDAVPYSLLAGKAQIYNLRGSIDDIKMERLTQVPILERSEAEPFIRSATSVEKVGDIFRCVYVSAHSWTEALGKPLPSYHLATLDSSDGHHWTGDGKIAVNVDGDDEFGLGRPWLDVQQDDWKLYFCIRSRSEPYRIAYASSKDQGATWMRHSDISGLERSDKGWDSEMICYPATVHVGDTTYMFYNGNQHGRTGFGVARLEIDT